MIDALMACEAAKLEFVELGAVGHHAGFALDVRVHERDDFFHRAASDVIAAHAAVALHERNDDVVTGSAKLTQAAT